MASRIHSASSCQTRFFLLWPLVHQLTGATGNFTKENDLSVNHFFVLLCLKIIATASHRQWLRMSSRLKSLGPRAQTIAMLGFAKEKDRLLCCICGATGDSDLVTVAHKSDCLYVVLYEVLHGQRTLPSHLSPQDLEMLFGLQKIMASPRAQTIEELGYSRDRMCVMFTRRWLRHRDFYKNAGQLLDDLETAEAESEAIEGDDLIPAGIADEIVRLDPSKASVISDSREKCSTCRAAPVAYMLLPCEHRSLCEQCSRTKAYCGICHQRFSVLLGI